MTKLLNGLEEIAQDYDGFIIDIFGVIHDGLELLPHTIETLTYLKANNKTVCFLSNSPRRADDAGRQCLEMGLPEDLLPAIMTSGEASHHALEEFITQYGSNCWFISNGKPELATLTEGINANFLEGPEGADFILNSIPGTEETEKGKLLADLGYAAELDLPMICANPDLVVHIGDKLHECAGTFAKIYEDIGGHVTYFGKPYEPVYIEAQKKLGEIEKEKTCAIGDSFHTDIQGANNFGIDSIFNLAGIHREELGLDPATKTVNSEIIQKLLEKQTHKPTYIMDGFKW